MRELAEDSTVEYVMTANTGTSSSQDCFQVPVLIVGGGPSGLLQSYLLSQLGVQSLIVERYFERLGAPKAHALSPRSLEICRQFGLDVKTIRQLGTKRQDASWVNFLTSLTGDTIGRLPYERMDPGVLETTPEMLHNIPQPVFENFVADHLLMATNAEIRKGVSFVSLDQTSDGVTTTVEERNTGRRYQVRSRYVIACDGARSQVREDLKIESDGETSYETMMTIHFSANLRPVVGERVGMLHWIFDPIAAGFIIAYDLSDNAVLISNFDAEKYPVEFWSEELCKQVLKGAIGKDIDPIILSYRPWMLSRKVARSYRHGAVFLAGDAAHSFPPTGGLGLNSGIADVHNLAFKIAAVLSGQASDTLLDIYELERRPIAEVNSRQSVNNGKKIFELLKTLGTAGMTDLEQARANMFQTIRDPSRQSEVQRGIEEQREHFDNLNLHIGYVYGDSIIPEHASTYRPQFVPGSRLPHAWIEASNIARLGSLVPIDVSYVSEFSVKHVASRQYSTLDLCSPDAFTVIFFACTPQHYQASSAIARICKTLDPKINVYHRSRDFDLILTPAAEVWLKAASVVSKIGVVVRPDQHILCTLAEDTAAEYLLCALENYLGRRQSAGFG